MIERVRLMAMGLLTAIGMGWTPIEAANTVQVLSGNRIVVIGEHQAHHYLHDAQHGLVSIPVSDQQIPAGKLSLHAEPGQLFGDSYINVPVTIMVNGQPVRKILAGYRIVQFVMRPTAIHDLEQGHVLSHEDLVMTKVLSDGSSAPQISALVGRVLTCLVAKGQIPQMWQTVTNIVVHSGEPVVLVIRDGDVSLTDDVVARSSGGVGDPVVVYDTHADRTINATITGPGEVEVLLSGEGDS